MPSGPSVIIGSLVTIGDEILLGDIPNGNAHHISSELRAHGFRLDRMITIGDRVEAIAAVLRQCLAETRFLIVTGGLGPTDDDLTCEAVSRALNRPLIPHEHYTSWLKERVESRGRTWSRRVARMAELPEGAVKLGVGMAGFSIEHEGIPCYFLPGVPHEMKALLADLVIPDLDRRFPHRMFYRKHILRVQGMAESEINRRLEGIKAEQSGCQIGYLPQVGENWITILAGAKCLEEVSSRIKEAEDEIVSRVGLEYISGTNEECLELVIGRQLREKGWRLAVAESCTGGLLSSRITAIAGASDYFERGLITYSNAAKMELLKVPEALLKSHGAVSEPTALAMAEGTRSCSGADVSAAITGIAGPTGGTAEKPVGTVFIACATPEKRAVEKHLFSGDRRHIQECAAQAALALLWRTMSHDPSVHSH